MMIKSYKRTNYKDLYLIASNMLNMQKAGISIINSLGLIIELPLSRKFKNSILGVKYKVESGFSLYESFKEYKDIYPDLFLSLIKIGEDTGKLEDVLAGLETYYKKVDFINKRIVSVLTYPSLLIVAMCFLSIFLIFGVIPTFGDIFLAMDKELPLALDLILNLNNIVINSPFVAILTFIVWFIIIPLIIIVYNKKYFYAAISKINIIKRFKEYISIVILSIIVNSGIGLSKGLLYCTECNLVANLNYEFALISDGIFNGRTLTNVIEESDIFTKYTVAHIKLGEECGNLECVLDKLEEQLFNKLNYHINKNLEMISPIAICLIGGMILSFMLIFVMPIFEGMI